MSTRFDADIAGAVGDYWRDFARPQWWKAQLCQESQLDPNARSSVGAEGLAQIMPGTYQQIVRQLHWDSPLTAFDPERAIEAGAFYQGNQRRSWSAVGRTPEERNRLGLCGYNAGLGNCLKAQRLCPGPAWGDISGCLARVTGALAEQTLTYVSRITAYAADIGGKK